MDTKIDEDAQLRSVALQNAASIQLARQRAEDELVRTQEALRRSQERLRAALAAANTGTFRWDFDTNAVEWDGNLAGLLGFAEAAVAPPFETTVAAIDTDDRSVVEARYQQCRREGCDLDMEFRVRWPDGSTHWIANRAKSFVDAAGHPVYMTGACIEITARKAGEVALREEARILELLNATGHVLASQLELQAVVQAVTDAATQLSGAEFGTFFYNTIDDGGERFRLDALSGAPRAAFEQFEHAGAASLLERTFCGEAPIRIADVLTDAGYGARGPHQEMPAGHVPVRSYLAVAVRSQTGEILGGLFFWHSATGVFTERSERLIVGVAAHAGIAIDNARLYETVRQASEERRLLLDSERAARTTAERMSEVKDQFLATLSHELRTPLNAILGWSQVLRSGPKGEDDYRKGLETIERNARLQAQLIDDLLDMSRITSGKLRLDVQQITPAGLIEAAVDSLEPAAHAKGIRIEKVLDPTAGPLSGDPGRLQQVVWNLVSNAIKFTPKKGKVQVILERVNSHIEISVADTGIGIGPELLPYLFERFRQGDASTTRQHGGLGLGLSIVKSLVELHGGTVAAKSFGLDQGTTVTVELPIAVVHRSVEVPDRQHPGTTRPAPPAVAAPELAGLVILVVDDQSDARDLIRRVLEDCAAAVLTAGSVSEALVLLDHHRPDVLISDIGMPQADGFELLRRVRARSADRGGTIPSIALTAFARSEDRIRALRAGFVVHVSKPVDPSELVATVASVAGRIHGTG